MVRASVKRCFNKAFSGDEFIASLAWIFPEQTRFTLVRDAIGAPIGADYSARTAAI